MSATVSAVMELTQPGQVSCAFNPCTQLIDTRDARVLVLQECQVHPVLERPFDVSVMQLEGDIQGAVGEVTTSLAYRTLIDLGIVFRGAVVVIEVLVVRVPFTASMLREVNVVVARVGLDVGCHHMVAG